MRLSSAYLTISLLVGSVAGCGSDDTGALDSNDPQPVVTRDYHQDAKAVMDRYCTSCHTAGGIAPFTLTDYASAQSHAEMIRSAVDADRMPPWMPDDDGVTLRYSRKMRPEDKQVLLDWIKDGAVEGDPAAANRLSIPPANSPAPPRTDLLVDMGLSYTPNAMLTDDYRCFVIDPGPGGTGGFSEDRYLRAGDVIPGNPAIVHHVIVYQISASAAAAVKQKDADEAGPGYTCFGGPGANNASLALGWAPGGVPMRLSDDEGMLLKKGSIFVMQVHYNLLNNNGMTDRTIAHMEFLSTPPPYQVFELPLANPNGLKIMAGDADASQTIVAPVAFILSQLKLPGNALTITSVAPHMHLLGTSITTSVDSQKLVEIPAWQFHWQQGYLLDQPFAAQTNQNLILECHYDNSATHQPYVNGAQQQPRDVTWGEGTLDEMCLSFIGVRIPRQTP